MQWSHSGSFHSGAAAKVFEYIDRRPNYTADAPRFAIADPDPMVDKGRHGWVLRDHPDSTSKIPLSRGRMTSKSGSHNCIEGAVEASIRDRSLLSQARVPVMPVIVSLQNVFFAYPSRSEVEVLRNFNLEARPGQVVALVGSSGSGKSTVFHLLEHFYEPTSGSVLLNGIDVRAIDHASLHRQVPLPAAICVTKFTCVAVEVCSNCTMVIRLLWSGKNRP